MSDKKAPARELIDRRAIVALASDFNPGSSNLLSMLFVLQLGVFYHEDDSRGSPECLYDQCHAIDRQDEAGSIEVGKSFDLLAADLPSYIHLAYELGRNPVRTVIKRGKIVVDEGQIIKK